MAARKPDAPAAELRPAAWWRRALAGIVDTAVWGAVAIPTVTRGTRAARHDHELVELPSSLRRVLRAGGLVLTLARWRGESPGHRVAGLTVRDRASGRRPGLVRLLARIAIEQAPSVVANRLMGDRRARDRVRRRARFDAWRAQLAEFDVRAFASPEERREALREIAPPMRGAARPGAEHLLIVFLLRRIAAPLRERIAGNPVAVRRA